MNGKWTERFIAVTVIVLVISAGCSGQQGWQTSPNTETASETEAEITSDGAPFPVESDVVFHRVETLLGEELSVPTIRVLRVHSDNQTHVLSTDEFSHQMGIVQRQSMNEVGGNTHEGIVRIFYTENATAAEMEQVLAHEFVHVSQPPRLRQRLASEQGSHHGTTDAQIVRDAVVEGTAVYVANQYTDQYLSNATEQATYPEWTSFSAGTKWHLSPYYFGSKYVQGRIDAPNNIATMYADPPITTEQLLHRYEPATEPPTNLTVGANVAESSWEVENSDTKGELFVRIVLAEQLDDSRAATAAAGWGNDRVITFENRHRSLHAWTLRWDDEQNATEFKKAVVAYLDARATERDGIWTDSERQFDVRQIDETTVVVFVGNASVEDTSVAVSNSNVSIRPGATD